MKMIFLIFFVVLFANYYSLLPVQCSSPPYASLGLNAMAVRPLILHHPHMVEGVEPVGEEVGNMSWLYDFYPNYPNALGYVHYTNNIIPHCSYSCFNEY